MSDGRRLLLTVGIPIALVGAIFYGPLIPGFLQGFFDGQVVPFTITYWLGLNFSNMYFYMTKDLEAEGASPRTISIMVVALAFVFFIAGGGPSVIWREPWLFGAAVMPGVDIVLPAVRRWVEGQQQPALAPAEEDALMNGPLAAEAAPPADSGS